MVRYLSNSFFPQLIKFIVVNPFIINERDKQEEGKKK